MKNKLNLLFIAFSLFIGINSFAHSSDHPSPVIVIFGATGDLTARKLMPAISHLASDNHIGKETTVIGFARQEYTDALFRQQVGEALKNKNENWQSFEKHLFYTAGDFESDAGYVKLQRRLAEVEANMGENSQRIYYLATHPKYFATIVKQLHKHDLSKEVKIIFEKPFGDDLASALDLQNCISDYLDESQVYRMDHYLGKEGLQNILTLRFDSALFEPLWHRQFIDHVQITIAEDIGIGSRGRFWEETGLLKDIFQNHLMQILTTVAMEPPASLSAHHIRLEKIKVLQAIRPFSLAGGDIIRGQYHPGLIQGKPVPGYKQEADVAEHSGAETFVAAKIFIDNERWKGVPFYVRSGKRLARQTAEVAITFKKNPSSTLPANVLFIRIQPHAGIFLKTLSKVPMLANAIKPVTFGYVADAYFQQSSPEAYEKLIYDCIQGRRHLFVDGEEQIAAWRLVMPVLHHWKAQGSHDLLPYEAGTWGPEAADQMLLENGHAWQFLE